MFGPADPPEPRFGLAEALAAGACLALFALLAWAALALPAEPVGLAATVAERLPESGLGNAVNAVLLNFRAFDTLLEKAVLLLALVGLWGLAPGVAWRVPPGNFLTEAPPEPQLVLLLKVLVPLSLLAALYLLWLGADEPGGAFQAGTVIAAVGILLVLGRVLPSCSHGGAWPRAGAAFGFLLFAGLGLGCLALGRSFLDFPPPLAKPLILAIEAGITLSVAVTLFLLASGLPPRPGGRPGSRSGGRP